MIPLARNQMAMEIASSKMAGKNHMAITWNNLVGQITLVVATIGKIGEFMHCVNWVKANLDLYDAMQLLVLWSITSHICNDFNKNFGATRRGGNIRAPNGPRKCVFKDSWKEPDGKWGWDLYGWTDYKCDLSTWSERYILALCELPKSNLNLLTWFYWIL